MNRINQRGATLMELILAIAVLTVGLLPIMNLMQKSANRLDDALIDLKMVMAGQNLINDLRSYKWDKTATSLDSFVTTPSPIPDPSDGLIDDIDDFHGYSDEPFPNITREVEVTYATLDGSDEFHPVTGITTNYKLVRVTVSRTGSLLKKKTLVTVFSNGHT